MTDTSQSADNWDDLPRVPSLKTYRRQMDRLPPYSAEMEQGVLGCILLSPNDCMGECIEKLKDNGKETFYDLRHQTIYEALAGMFDAREAIDIITLQQRLKDKGLLEQIGGIPYLSQLQDAVPSAANLSYYLESVREKYLLRQMLRTCTDVTARIYEHEGDVDQFFDEVERDILRVAESRVENVLPTMPQIVIRVIDKIQTLFERRGEITGLKTGFPDLDWMTDGLQPSTMVVLAGRPSLGKTSLAMNIVENVAIEQKLPVGVFSLEMDSESLILRMACSLARISLRNVRAGYFQEPDLPKLVAATDKLRRAPIYIDDTAGLSILQIRARCRRMAKMHGIKLAVIDYLQLACSNTKRGKDNRQQEITDISCGIKAMAKELKIPVLVLSQLNREVDRDKKRKPRLSDIRESGSIEQDADVVGLLYKADINAEEEDDSSDGCSVNLLIAKQRNGPVGDVNLTFLKPFTRFESAAKVRDADIPQDPRMKD
jgi:replicative DNA helicase